jgi:hypothetical protein
MENKKKLCPKCIGVKEVFNGKFVTECPLCKGTGEVELDEQYDPINDEIDTGLNDL